LLRHKDSRALKALEEKHDTSKVESENSTDEETPLMSRKLKQMLKYEVFEKEEGEIHQEE